MCVKKKTKKKRMQNLKWATAHLNLITRSRYSHCIVTPRLENWPEGGRGGGGGGGGGGTVS